MEAQIGAIKKIAVATKTTVRAKIKKSMTNKSTLK